MFGHEEILNKTLRKTKAICFSSKSTIFSISKDVNTY